MFNAAEDDDLFNPAASSSLAALFGTQVNIPQNLNQSLVYTAPRQPKANTTDSTKEGSPKSKPLSSVLCAKAVTLYKCTDNKYSVCGKYGLALIGSDVSKTYEIIIYKDKQNILTRAKLLPTFAYILQNDNFASFYDDQKQSWLVLFETASDFQEFSQELEKRGARISSNTKKLEKETDVQKEPTKETTDTVLTKPVADKDGNINSDSSGTHVKADILSRMAKMGQSILPITAIRSSVSDQSDSDSEMLKKAQRKSKRGAQSVTKPAVPVSKPESLTANQLTSEQRPYFSNANTQMVPLQNNIPPQYQSHSGQVVFSQPNMSPTYDPLNIFLAENRTQNSEIRMNISQVSNKLDEVLWKINHNDRESGEEKLLRAKVKALELKVSHLTQELEDSINANTELQEQLYKTKRSSDKSCDSTLLQEVDRHKEVVGTQRQKIEALELQLLEKDMQVDALEFQTKDLIKCQNLTDNLLIEVENQTFQLSNFEVMYAENKDNPNFLRSVYTALVVKMSKMNSQIEEFERLQRISEECKSHNQQKRQEFVEMVSAVLTDLQQHIVKHFDASNNSLPPDFVTKALPRSIKTATNYIVKEFQKHFEISFDGLNTFSAQEPSLSEFSD